jgi:hypothetical protein
MNPIERPRFSDFRMPGWPTVLGLLLFAGVLWGSIHFGIGMPSRRGGGGGSLAGWGLLIGVVVVFTALTALDKKLYLDKKAKRLRDYGFDLNRFSLDDIDEENDLAMLAVLGGMEPEGIGVTAIERWGELVGASRRTVAGVAHVSAGRSEQSFVFVLAAVECDLPPFSLGREVRVRRKALAKQGITPLELEHEAYSKKRCVFALEESPERDRLARALESLGDLFFVPKARANPLTLAEDPGKHEQWAFAPGWLVYAERGRAKAEPLIHAVELVHTVAERLEGITLSRDGAGA